VDIYKYRENKISKGNMNLKCLKDFVEILCSSFACSFILFPIALLKLVLAKSYLVGTLPILSGFFSVYFVNKGETKQLFLRGVVCCIITGVIGSILTYFVADSVAQTLRSLMDMMKELAPQGIQSDLLVNLSFYDPTYIAIYTFIINFVFGTLFSLASWMRVNNILRKRGRR
jgi:peptidoglycan/LPS O-acetylase OafA/YrhL